MIVETDNKDQALQIVTPLFRNQAKITTLVKYVKEHAAEGLEYHKK